jgi:hypothetical protein
LACTAYNTTRPPRLRCIGRARNALAIVQRAIASSIRTQGAGDMYPIAAIAKRARTRFRLAFMPDDFTQPAPDDFDRDYMNALFLVGYKLGRDGYPWATQPPGFVGG